MRAGYKCQRGECSTTFGGFISVVFFIQKHRFSTQDIHRVRDESNALRKQMGGATLLPANIVNEEDANRLLTRDTKLSLPGARTTESRVNSI